MPNPPLDRPRASAHPMMFVLDMAEDDDPNRASNVSNREVPSEEWNPFIGTDEKQHMLLFE